MKNTYKCNSDKLGLSQPNIELINRFKIQIGVTVKLCNRSRVKCQINILEEIKSISIYKKYNAESYFSFII